MEQEMELEKSKAEYDRLVRLNSNDLSRQRVVTDSLIVAKEFGKTHDKVLRDIRELKKQLKNSLTKEEFSLSIFGESNYVNERGREYTKYELNERAFMLLVMSYNTKEALKIKNDFITAFEKQEDILLSHKETRAFGVYTRRDLTDSIKCLESANEKIYAEYTGLINKKVLGVSAYKYRILNNIPKSGEIRNYLSPDQLNKLAIIENKVASMVEIGREYMDEKALFEKVNAYIDDYKLD